ncbi:MAG: DUF6515 family protein [Rikenellaceae bacterium]
MKTKITLLSLATVLLLSSLAIAQPQPKRVTTPVSRSVTKSAVIKNNNLGLTILNGRYYKPGPGNKSVLIAPPVGLVVNILPGGYRTFVYGGLPYYFCSGVVYVRNNNNEYEVVKAQNGMVVPELPDEGVSRFVIDNALYFKYDNVVYKQIPTTEGLQYEVVGSIEG